MDQYYVIQNSRYSTGEVILLADPNKVSNPHLYWTQDPKKAQVYDDIKDATYTVSSLQFNNARVISIRDYNNLYGKKEQIQLKDTIKQTNQNFTDMFENIQNSMNGLFGKVASGMCRLTMNGNIAVKCKNGYKTYNVSKGTLTNVTNFCFNVGDEMFFVIPTTKVSVGDIILVNGEPKCVINAEKNDITVIDYNSSEVKHIVPERHVFMGSTYFYGKIISMFGNSFKNGNGMKNMIQMMMMSQMMGNNSGSSNGMMGNIGQMMAMSMFMNNKNNPFEGMFDFDTDSPMMITEDDDDLEEDEEDEPVKTSKKSRFSDDDLEEDEPVKTSKKSKKR